MRRWRSDELGFPGYMHWLRHLEYIRSAREKQLTSTEQSIAVSDAECGHYRNGQKSRPYKMHQVVTRVSTT